MFYIVVLKLLSTDRTVIVIAHRLSTIQGAGKTDRISRQNFLACYRQWIIMSKWLQINYKMYH